MRDFLIYTTDTPGSGHYITDKHYRVLMDLFYEERQARIYLEDVVTPMQRKLFNKTQLATFETISKTQIQKVAVKQNSIKVAKGLSDITAYNERSIIAIYKQ